MGHLFGKFGKLAVIAGVMALSACSPAATRTGIQDPHEAKNRAVHEANARFDRQFISPVSTAYGKGIPAPVRRGVANFADNAGLPGVVVNDLLQGKIEDATHNSIRFLVNTLFGFAGLLDIAGPGMPERDTDFGETLHVWGFGEGDYVVLPIFGPSTERDGIGTIVDFVLNPLDYVLPYPYNKLPLGSEIISRFGDRYSYGATYDEVFYGGADSYATARLYYLDHRRFQLSGEQSTEELYELYEEVYE